MAVEDRHEERISDLALSGIGSYVTGQLLPGVSSVANTAGAVSGALHEDALSEIKARGHAAKSLIPGVGAYRQGVIARAVADESGKRGRNQLLHEIIGSRLGNFGVGMAGAAGGAALAKKLGHKDLAPMAVAGGIGGLVAPSVVAAIVALSTKTRTKKEQDEAEKRNLLLNYIPGYGDYQYMKRLGRGYDEYLDKNVTENAGDKDMHLTEAIKKQAYKERVGDYALGRVSDYGVDAVLPGADLVVNTPAHLAGLLQGDAREDVKERGSTALSLIPGVSAYRQGRIQRAVADESGKRGRKQLLHEVLGNVGGTIGGGIAGGALGAGVGYALDPTDEDMIGLGAFAGGAAGALLPNLSAGLLALIKKTRTKKEQSKHEEGNLAKNYIPGVGQYNLWKRLGSGYDRYYEDDKKKIKKKAGDQSMGHLTEAIIGQTSEPRKEAVRNLLSKEAMVGGGPAPTPGFSGSTGKTITGDDIESYDKKKKKKKKKINKVASDRINVLRAYITKLANDDEGEYEEEDENGCGEKGHYCGKCDSYMESTSCPCGYSCGCAMSKEAGDYKCPGCGKACPDCGSMKKEASDRKNAVRSLLYKEATDEARFDASYPADAWRRNRRKWTSDTGLKAKTHADFRKAYLDRAAAQRAALAGRMKTAPMLQKSDFTNVFGLDAAKRKVDTMLSGGTSNQNTTTAGSGYKQMKGGK